MTSVEEKVGGGLDEVKITFGDLTTVYMRFNALTRLLRDVTVLTWVKEECWFISYYQQKKKTLKDISTIYLTCGDSRKRREIGRLISGS